MPKLVGKLAALNATNHLNLPRLPVPALEQTLQRYLMTVAPLTDQQGYRVQEANAKAFLEGVGPQLQASLLEKEKARAEAGGYPYFHFEEQWDDAYLAARCPNPTNINPLYILEKPSFLKDTPVTLTASYVHAAATWLINARENGVTEDGGDLSQIPLFLGFARIPKKGRDDVEFHGNTTRHVVVQCGGEFFKVDVLSKDGQTVLPYEGIAAQFNDIYAYGKRQRANGAESSGIGALTGLERDDWAAIREKLTLLGNNKATLQTIDEAMLMVGLDLGDSSRDEGLVGQVKSILHGTTSAPNETLTNRWFDKHQLIADEGGAFGYNFEHAASDGAGWNKTIGEIYKVMSDNSSTYTAVSGGSAESAEANRIEFTVNDFIAKEVDNSKRFAHKTFQQGVDLGVLMFNDFGKDEFKRWGMSPDAVMQVAFQTAYQSVHGKAAPTYEACAMRGFFHGRTETIRSCLPANDAFAKGFNGDASTEVLKGLLQEAVKTQSAQAKLAAAGQGIDRHLMSLKNEGSLAGMDLDQVALFNNALYKHSGDWILSTSNVTAPFVHLFGFGAVTTNGYGLGYMVCQGEMMKIVGRKPFYFIQCRSCKEKSSNAKKKRLTFLQKKKKMLWFCVS